MKNILLLALLLPFCNTFSIASPPDSTATLPPADSSIILNDPILDGGIIDSDTVITEEIITETQESDSYLSPAEKRKLKQDEKSKERQAKEKERLSKKPTFEEFLSRWQPYTPCGHAEVDVFCAAASDMVVRYKLISDSLNFIKIEVVEIPDDGDGITQAIKITDGNGNPRTKESIQEKWTYLGAQIAVMAVDLTSLGISGANVVTTFSSNPENLLNFSVLSQLRRSIQAINMLTVEIRRSVPIIQEQTALMKTLKSN